MFPKSTHQTNLNTLCILCTRHKAFHHSADTSMFPPPPTHIFDNVARFARFFLAPSCRERIKKTSSTLSVVQYVTTSGNVRPFRSILSSVNPFLVISRVCLSNPPSRSSRTKALWRVLPRGRVVYVLSHFSHNHPAAPPPPPPKGSKDDGSLKQHATSAAEESNHFTHRININDS